MWKFYQTLVGVTAVGKHLQIEYSFLVETQVLDYILPTGEAK